VNTAVDVGGVGVSVVTGVLGVAIPSFSMVPLRMHAYVTMKLAMMTRQECIGQFLPILLFPLRWRWHDCRGRGKNKKEMGETETEQGQFAR